MCGIAGFLELKRRSGPDELRAIAARMADRLSHRGPDDQGVWIDPEAGVALGHTRLAIIDLSPAGAQPMVSSCGRFVLSYNGEVYNAPELRAELQAAGRPFRGHSDTEVMVEGFAVWGVQADDRAADRHVRVRGVGSLHARLSLWRATASASSRSIGAAPMARLVFASELQGSDRVPRLARRDRPRRARRVPPLRLCADADEHLSRRSQAARRERCSNAGEDGEVTQHGYWSLADVAARGPGLAARP